MEQKKTPSLDEKRETKGVATCTASTHERTR